MEKETINPSIIESRIGSQGDCLLSGRHPLWRKIDKAADCFALPLITPDGKFTGKLYAEIFDRDDHLYHYCEIKNGNILLLKKEERDERMFDDSQPLFVINWFDYVRHWADRDIPKEQKELANRWNAWIRQYFVKMKLKV